MKKYFVAVLFLMSVFLPFKIYAEETTLYSLSDVMFREENGKQIAYLKNGNIFSGAVIINDEQGREITYFYKNGLKDGVAVSHYGDGKIELEITYSKGTKNGEEILFYANGKPQYQRTYKNDILDGEEIIFYENGNPKQKNTYKDGVLNGESGYYTEDGGVLKIEHYKDGIKHGMERIVENNVLKAEHNYENGKLSGISKIYNGEYQTDEIIYKNGLKEGKHTIYQKNGYRAEIPYVNDEKSGEGFLFSPDKKVLERVMYRDDKKNGMKIKYTSDGKVKEKEYYKNDKKDGISRKFNDKGELVSVAFYVEGNKLADNIIANNKLLNDIYKSFLEGHLNRYIKVKNYWYAILWLGLSSENADIIGELEREMKMYGADINDIEVYKKESLGKYDDYNRELYFGLNPFSYLINLEAPVDILNKFENINEVNARGTTPIQESVRLNNIEIVNYLLLKGIDVNKKYNDGNTILLNAVKDSSVVEVIDKLLKAGAEVDAVDVHGYTPLALAVKQNNADIADILLKYHADTVKTALLGENILHYVYDNFGAEKLFDVLLKYTKDVNIKDKNGELLILKALKNKDYSTVRKLLLNGADVDIKNQEKRSAVSYAVDNDVPFEVQEAIISKAREFNINVEPFDKPLWQILLTQNKPDLLRIVIEKSDITNPDNNGNIPLYYILKESKYDQVKADALAKVSQITDDIAWEILKMNNIELFQKLSQKGFNASTLAENGETMMEYIIKHGYDLKFADILISQGFDIETLNQNGQTALSVAINQNDIAWVKKLIYLGADVNKIIGEKLYLSNAKKNQKEIADVLIQNGTNTDFVTIKGETILMSAVRNLNIPLIQYLLDMGADVDAKDNDGRSAMFYLADSLDIYPDEKSEDILPLWIKIIQLLKENGADINEQDGNGDTLLILAIQKQNDYSDKIRSILIEEGADTELKNQYGKKADDYRK